MGVRQRKPIIVFKYTKAADHKKKSTQKPNTTKPIHHSTLERRPHLGIEKGRFNHGFSDSLSLSDMETSCRTTTTRPNAHRHTLTRRNSIATSVNVPGKLTLPPKLPHHSSASFPASTAGYGGGCSSSSSTTSSSQSFPAVDFELISIKPLSYTSLKDLLPSPAVQSPTSSAPAATTAGGGSGYEISIRNRLVKQAAWAYLQPMSTSPDSSSAGRHLLHRIWARISYFLRFFSRALTRAFDQVLRAVRIGSSR